MSIKIEKILELYETIKTRLPHTYPKPRLVFFEDDVQMAEYHKFKMEKDEILYGTFDGKETIGIPLTVYKEFEYKSGKSKLENISISSNMDYLAVILLHELAHAYFGKKYGYSSKQYDDEAGCDRFAYRWLKTMKKEKLL